MFDEDSAAVRRTVRLVRLLVIAVAATVVGWYALQFRPSRLPQKSPLKQVAILRDHEAKPFARLIAAEAIDEADAVVLRELTAELSAGDDAGRQLSAFALGRLGAGASAAADALIARLDDPSQSVRQQAAIALGRIGARPEDAAAALARSVRGADDEVRTAEFKALRRLGAAGIHRLIGLLDDAEADLRRRAAIELGRIDDADSEVIAALRGRLHDADPRVRAETLAALARHAAISLDELKASLQDADFGVRSTGCALLARMGPNAAPAVGELVKAFERDASRIAAEALQNLGENSFDLTARLAPLLDSDNEHAQVETAILMGAVGQAREDARDRLLAQVDSRNERLASQAFWALRETGLEGRLRPPELIAELAAAGEEVHALILWDPSFIPPNRNREPSRVEAFAQGYGVVDSDLARLVGLKQLRLLDLRYNRISDAGLEHVAQFKQLERLELAKTNVTSTGLARLAGLTKLRWLSLADCQIDDRGLEHLKQLVALEFLDLGNTQVTDAGLQNLSGLSRLKTLWLYGTQTTDAGLARLSSLAELEEISYSKHYSLRGLAQLKSLTVLQPQSESVNNDDLALLVDMPRLRELNLSQSNVTDAALEHVGKLKQLKSLNLHQTAITDRGLERIGQLTQLEVLSLSQTAITDAGLAKLSGLTELTFLGVDKTQTTEAGLIALKRALPKLMARWAWGSGMSPRADDTYRVLGLKPDDEPDAAPPVP